MLPVKEGGERSEAAMDRVGIPWYNCLHGCPSNLGIPRKKLA